MSNPNVKHTPGPWFVSPDTDSVRPTIITEHGEMIAECDDSTPETESNARLIAAAPELLAWTVELLAQLKRDHPTGMDGIKEHVSKLIERATGGAE